MKNTNQTRLVAKPHIILFVRKEYYRPDIGCIYLPHPCQLLNLVERYLTPQFKARATQLPDGLKFFDVLLPERIHTLFLSSDRVHALQHDIEGWYWTMAKLQLLRLMVERDLKMSQAIEAFYTEYGYTEETYSRDSFRRQITRTTHSLPSLRGIRPRALEAEPRVCRKVRNSEARRIRQLHREGKSYRAIGKLYGLDGKTVKKIIERLSQKSAAIPH